jgi:thiamine biosynthesis lipoprotein
METAVPLVDAAMATAGGSRHFFEYNGHRYSHVIDPATGRPARGPVRTASVHAGSCLRANSLATAALVWGVRAHELLAGRTSRLVMTDGTVVNSGAWAQDVAA